MTNFYIFLHLKDYKNRDKGRLWLQKKCILQERKYIEWIFNGNGVNW